MRSRFRSRRHLSDSTLLQQYANRLADDRTSLVESLYDLSEIDRRRLYATEGYSSMRAFCVGVHNVSDDVAFKQIRVMRLARRLPQILAMLEDGRLHLSGLVVMARYLTPQNADELLAAAARKTRKAIEQMIANRFPKPDVPTAVRVYVSDGTTASLAAVAAAAEASCTSATQLAPGPVSFATTELVPELAAIADAPPAEAAGSAASPSLQLARGPVLMPDECARVTPLGIERVGLHLMMSQSTFDKLRRAQELLSHQLPSGDIPQVLDRALDALIAQLEKRKLAATDRPSKSPRPTKRDSRHIPAPVKRAVRKRDGDRCAYVAPSGKRCEERRFLQFHHIDDYARGGQATVENIQQRCHAHNQYAAEQTYGAEFIQRKREQARSRASADSGATTNARLG